ncbi:MAG: menaquinone-9 beta-reductase [Actinomycetota bacterium]|nr:menaquinone-9 beta-reductase [Actinomycetota bacterium]
MLGVTTVRPPEQCDVLVVGAGPAGAAAATWLARSGRDVVLADAASFPRDKPCGDGLTPRAISELTQLGLSEWLTGLARNWGLRATGFGEELYLPWPGGSLPKFGGAARRTLLDTTLRDLALAAGATGVVGRAVDVDTGFGPVTSVTFRTEGGLRTVNCRNLVVADGAKSQLGRRLGRQWHRTTAFGVAARGYIASDRSDDPWISSHLELRDSSHEVLSGYGWVFPLADGTVNVGVGTLATSARPAETNLRSLLGIYAEQRREEWGLRGEVEAPWSALLPMGGAVSGVAGPNWLLVGDAAGCVNPLNGEGIDYGLETGRLAAELLATGADCSGWPSTLASHYGQAFSIARRLAGLLTVPGLLPTAGPFGMRSRSLMKVALRLMGNLVTDEDRDLVARSWKIAGRASLRFDERPPFAA